jgi:hypothetical protein
MDFVLRFAKPSRANREEGLNRYMDSPAGYLHIGIILISYPNLLVIGGMVVLFGIALLAPFHGVGGEKEDS